MGNAKLNAWNFDTSHKRYTIVHLNKTPDKKNPFILANILSFGQIHKDKISIGSRTIRAEISKKLNNKITINIRVRFLAGDVDNRY